MKRSAILFLRSSSKLKRSATQKLKKLTSQEIDALPLLSLYLVLILCRVQKKKNNRSSSALYVKVSAAIATKKRRKSRNRSSSALVKVSAAIAANKHRKDRNRSSSALSVRYGEEADQVELLSDWSCPKCRGKCTCSCCRKKQGLVPTGQLVKTANASGYKSVDELLHNANNVSVLPMEEATIVERTGNDSSTCDKVLVSNDVSLLRPIASYKWLYETSSADFPDSKSELCIKSYHPKKIWGKNAKSKKFWAENEVQNSIRP
ncbi:hypothetical protein OROGR_024314 [Orobanche gracilis]